MADNQLVTDVRENWKIKEIIRHRLTGHPYLVIHIYAHRGTEVVDLQSRDNPAPMLVILPRDYEEYAEENQMDITEKKTKNLESFLSFNYHPVYL